MLHRSYTSVERTSGGIHVCFESVYMARKSQKILKICSSKNRKLNNLFDKFLYKIAMATTTDPTSPTQSSPDSPFPVQTSTFSTSITVPNKDEPLKLDVVLSKFPDRILVVVTTLGKPGALFEVTKSSANTDTARTVGLDLDVKGV